jgi:multidrug transporter EmrE-like cation transporter
MMYRLLDYSYIFMSIIFTVYGQLVVKWRVNEFGAFPSEPTDKMKFLAGLLIDPIILSAFVAAFLAALSWMAAMTKFQLNHAYPFMSLTFVLVFILSYYLLNEPITIQKSIGITLIVSGVIVSVLG